MLWRKQKKMDCSFLFLQPLASCSLTIYLRESACVRARERVPVCIGSICFNSQLCRSYKNIYPSLVLFAAHMHVYVFVAFIFSFCCCCCCCELGSYHASKLCVETVILWEIDTVQKPAEWIYKKHVAFLLDASIKKCALIDNIICIVMAVICVGLCRM